jgi:hypothetical protein
MQSSIPLLSRLSFFRAPLVTDSDFNGEDFIL